MNYRESATDKKLRKWFGSDNTKSMLKSIRIKTGQIRGITPAHIEFDYPISAFAGINGAGKSTILALACCAFHNTPNGYKPPKRQTNYYTFKDFFVQHSDEIPPQGIEIHYSISHNKWKKSTAMPDGIGTGIQIRKKKSAGKWNDYAERIKRNVVFLGIERIVPHSERSHSKSYSRSFRDTQKKGWEASVKSSVGKILGKTYTEFRYLEHSKYNLPIVKCGPLTYSGFNMGAGENALFEIFSTIYSCGEGALLVIDEIELGLHSRAQRLFMDELKETCSRMKIQVICTTHSKEIFDCLPDDGRFFVESVAGTTKIHNGISSQFAFSKLSGSNTSEVDVYVEDPVAQCLVLSAIPASTRSRVSVKVIGSATAISRQLAAHYARSESKPVIAIFDGDQRPKYTENLSHARSMAEKSDANFDNWFASKCEYLPGTEWPESWVLNKCAQTTARPLTSKALSIEDEMVETIIEYGLQAGKHDEFHELSQHVGLTPEKCMSKLCDIAVETNLVDFSKISKSIASLLP